MLAPNLEDLDRLQYFPNLKILSVDVDLWKKEAEEIKEFFKKFEDKLPKELEEELTNLEDRLNK